LKVRKVIGSIFMILLVGVISFISFFGIYKNVDGNKENILKEYKLGMEFTNTTDLVLSVKEGTEATSEQYKEAKNIIKKRLNKMNVGQYVLTQDEENGKTIVKIQESEEALYKLINLVQPGILNIVDSEDDTVLLDNKDLKTAKVMYASEETGISVYLQLEFNDEGAKKLQEISKKYVETTAEQENEEGEKETVTTTKTVSVKIDGTTYSTTYFGETMTEGILYIPFMTGLTSEEVSLYAESLEELTIILNNGVLPDIYDYSFDSSSQMLMSSEIQLYVIAIVFVLILAIIYLVVRFKSKGILMGLMEIGYIAVLLLTIRYTNVIITISGIIGIVLSAVFNYLLLYMILETAEKGKKFKNTILEFLKVTIPVYIAAIILTFIPNDNISSVGMTLFWGSVVIYVFNFIFTKPILKWSQK